MNYKRHFLFFLGDFHDGTANHLSHFLGFTLLGFGLGRPNWYLVVISPLIMEFGHLYYYSKGIHKDIYIKIIPLQLLAWLIFTAFIYWITKSFGL